MSVLGFQVFQGHAFVPLEREMPHVSLSNLRQSDQLLLSDASLVPLFYTVLFFLAGIFFAHFFYLRPGLLLASMLPFAALGILAVWKASRLSWICIATVWIVLGIWSAETEPLPLPAPALNKLADGLLRTVEGTVISAGPIRNSGPESVESTELGSSGDSGDLLVEGVPTVESGQHIQRVDLRLDTAEVITEATDSMLPVPDSGEAYLRINLRWSIKDQIEIQCGQRLRAVVRMMSPEAYHDPGVWNYSAWLESQNIFATAMLSPEPDRLNVLGEPTRSYQSELSCLLDKARQSASNRIVSLPGITQQLPQFLRVNKDDAAMLAALIAGDRTFLSRTLRIGFERTGSFHLIVVSGMHLAILAGFLFTAARRARLRRSTATIITLAIALGYALFTGFAVPTQRSFWMLTLYLLGRLFFRNRSPLNVLGFATLCLLTVSPHGIFDASLQMTILSVATIVGVAAPLLDNTTRLWREATLGLQLITIDPKLPPDIAQFRVTLRLFESYFERATGSLAARKLLPFLIRSVIRGLEVAIVTTFVELALALPMALYFHRVTVYAIPVNIFILPLLGVLVPTAMVLLLLLSFWPTAAALPATLCVLILHLSVAAVRQMGGLSMGDSRIPQAGVFQIWVAMVFFVLALQLARMNGTQRYLSVASMVLVCCAVLWPRQIDHPNNALLVEAIDVGQGDSILLVSPSGKTLLIDAGGVGYFPSSKAVSSDVTFDVGEDVISPTLWQRGIRRLDAVALTHAHQDHMGGLPAVLRNFHPRELWVGENPMTPAYAALLSQARSEGIIIHRLRIDDTISLGSAPFQVDLRVLAPRSGYHPGLEPANNDSIVLQARYGQTRILLAGDAEAEEEQSMFAEPGLQSTVLKVGHHGSFSSTGPGFLSRVAPSWAVISCGRRNRFGHPRSEILSELEDAHVRTFRTDVDGVTCLLLDGKSVSAQPMCR